jgi:hypothetical protein
MNSKKASLYCRRGHKKVGKNVIWRRRMNQKTKIVHEVKECRKCRNLANAARKEARKRNEEIMRGTK